MTMKIIYSLLASIFFTFAGFIQETVQGQEKSVDTTRINTVRVDTIWVEKVKRDTIWVERIKRDTVLVERVKVETKQEPPKEAPKEPSSQNQKSSKKNEKIYYGGYANFSFGKYTVIGIEPLIGYKLLPKLSFGGKISYEYVNDKRYDIRNEVSNYGFSIFSRLRIGRKLYAHIEYSKMNYRLYDSIGNSERNWLAFFYLGGGISQPISKNVSINAEVLWDLNQDEDSPYKTVEPFFSVGIGVGF